MIDDQGLHFRESSSLVRQYHFLAERSKKKMVLAYQLTKDRVDPEACLKATQCFEDAYRRG